MKFFKNLSFSCKEATLFSLQKEEKQLSAVNKLKLYIHLSYCKYCRLFVKQSNMMDKGAKQYKESIFQNPPYVLSEKMKESIRKKMKES